MQKNIFEQNGSQTRLRAIVEVIDGEVAIFPIAYSDADRTAILDALRFIATEQRQIEARARSFGAGEKR